MRTGRGSLASHLGLGRGEVFKKKLTLTVYSLWSARSKLRGGFESVYFPTIKTVGTNCVEGVALHCISTARISFVHSRISQSRVKKAALSTLDPFAKCAAAAALPRSNWRESDRSTSCGRSVRTQPVEEPQPRSACPPLLAKSKKSFEKHIT